MANIKGRVRESPRGISAQREDQGQAAGETPQRERGHGLLNWQGACLRASSAVRAEMHDSEPMKPVTVLRAILVLNVTSRWRAMTLAYRALHHADEQHLE